MRPPRSWTHAILAGLVTASFLVLGVACWHLLHRRNVKVFRSAAKLAIVVALPVSVIQLGVGSEFGVAATDAQPMKIAATEALGDPGVTRRSRQRCGGFAHPALAES